MNAETRRSRQALSHEERGVSIIDTDPKGCVCTTGCEWPCLQRVGLTDEPCCDGCAPLPDFPPEDVDDHQGWRDWITNVTNDDDGIERLVTACRAGVNIGALLVPKLESEAA